MEFTKKVDHVNSFLDDFMKGNIVLDYSNADLNEQNKKHDDILKNILRYLDLRDTIQTIGDQEEHTNLIKRLFAFIIELRLDGIVVDLNKLERE